MREVASMLPPSTTVGIAGVGAGAGAGPGAGAGAGAGVPAGGEESPPPPPHPAAARTNNVGNHLKAARRDFDGVWCLFMQVSSGLLPTQPLPERRPMRAPSDRGGLGQLKCPARVFTGGG